MEPNLAASPDKRGRAQSDDIGSDDLAFYYRSGIASQSEKFPRDDHDWDGEEQLDEGRDRLVASWFSRRRGQESKNSAESTAESSDIGAGEYRRASSDARSGLEGHDRKVSSPSSKRIAWRLGNSESKVLGFGAEKPPVGPSSSEDGLQAGVDDDGKSFHGASQPRTVFSLLLRRKSSRRSGKASVSADGGSAVKANSREESDVPEVLRRASVACGDAGVENAAQGPARLSGPRSTRGGTSRKGFRRVRSQLHPPVSNSSGGEGGRYLEYAAELDDDSFERLVEFTKQIAQRHSGRLSALSRESSRDGGLDHPGPDIVDSEEIVGEIRLEDFADGSSEDFDFIDDDDFSEVGSIDAAGRPCSRNLRMDAQKLTWIGNETEFAAFFADFGLNDVLVDSEPPILDPVEFNVEPEVLEEWEHAAKVHNEECHAWARAGLRPLDIRGLVDAFSNRR